MRAARVCRRPNRESWSARPSLAPAAPQNGGGLTGYRYAKTNTTEKDSRGGGRWAGSCCRRHVGRVGTAAPPCPAPCPARRLANFIFRLIVGILLCKAASGGSSTTRRAVTGPHGIFSAFLGPAWRLFPSVIPFSRSVRKRLFIFFPFFFIPPSVLRGVTPTRGTRRRVHTVASTITLSSSIRRQASAAARASPRVLPRGCSTSSEAGHAAEAAAAAARSGASTLFFISTILFFFFFFCPCVCLSNRYRLFLSIYRHGLRIDEFVRGAWN